MMIGAVVLLCSLADQTCVTFVDERGPYTDMPQCLERVVEMVDGFREAIDELGMVPPPSRLNGQCVLIMAPVEDQGA